LVDGSILAIRHSGSTSTHSVLTEFSREGETLFEVQFAVQANSGSDLRDLILDGNGDVQLIVGTFDPVLMTIDVETSATRTTQLPGWSLVNNARYGGIAAYKNYVFVADMGSAGSSDYGFYRVDIATQEAKKVVLGSATGFGVTDLAVGLDGLLYATCGSCGGLLVFDPTTLVQVRTLPLVMKFQAAKARSL
jgi:hypothetical protein